MDTKAVFLATLPSILSCIKVSGDGGARLQLDVPDSDMAEALKLLLWRGMVLRVTVEPESDDGPTDSDDSRRPGDRLYI